ncbi:MAG: hypothetical protein HZB15_01175 [Actinobacteria bacterium]|nr:hypothetical protein [Actinomycetota bacterium]
MRPIASLAPAGPLVAPFAEQLLRLDLPRLDDARRREATAFAVRRVAGMPGVVRSGVLAVALPIRLALATPLAGATVRFLARRSLPLVGEYVRLVRSLGYAYIWETWPDTRPDGAPA